MRLIGFAAPFRESRKKVANSKMHQRRELLGHATLFLTIMS